MGHDVLGLDHNIIACADELPLGQADGVPLDDLLDVCLRERSSGSEGTEAEPESSWSARSEGEHLDQAERTEVSLSEMLGSA